MNKMTPFEDWWETNGSNLKNEPGENINDTELPFRVAKAAWNASVNHAKIFRHLSSCAVYNEPAYTKGQCDCGYLCSGECKHYLDIVSQIKNHVLVKFKSDDENEIQFAKEWAKNIAPKSIKRYVHYEQVPHLKF